MSLTSKLGLKDIAISGKRVLIRVDYNVPLEKTTDSIMRITNNQRITASLPTLKYCIDQKARCVVLVSHLGRPDGVRREEMSLAPVAEELTKLLPKENPVHFIGACVGDEVQHKISEVLAAANANHGSSTVFFLLENLRFHIEEEGSVKDEATGAKKKADAAAVTLFRKSLSALGDVYVNDAFGTAHRAHSSIVGIELAERVAGFLLKKELDYFGKALENPTRPFLAILGGAKVSDKIQLIQNLLQVVDRLYIAGGMAFTFLKTLHGVSIGKSLFDEPGSRLVPEIMARAKERGVSIHFPSDFVTAAEFKAKPSGGTAIYSASQGIPPDAMGLDIGPQSISDFKEKVLPGAKTVIWNGPAGVFEWDAFEAGTKSIAQSLAALLAAGAGDVTTIVGGGDTATAVEKFNLESGFSHVSTGGGAALELLEGKQLPGVVFLAEKKHKI